MCRHNEAVIYPMENQNIIRIKNMKFYAYHGVTETEKEIGNRFEVDCEFKIAATQTLMSDSLDDTVDYSSVYDLVSRIVTENKFNLVETLANKLADDIFEAYNLSRVRIRVRKIKPPMAGEIDCFEVETERKR